MQLPRASLPDIARYPQAMAVIQRRQVAAGRRPWPPFPRTLCLYMPFAGSSPVPFSTAATRPPPPGGGRGSLCRHLRVPLAVAQGRGGVWLPLEENFARESVRDRDQGRGWHVVRTYPAPGNGVVQFPNCVHRKNYSVCRRDGALISTLFSVAVPAWAEYYCRIIAARLSGFFFPTVAHTIIIMKILAEDPAVYGGDGHFARRFDYGVLARRSFCLGSDPEDHHRVLWDTQYEHR